MWEKHPHHQASKLNWSVLSRDNFGSWSDAQKLVQALVRAICEATAQADVKGKDKDGRAESIALAVATELSKSDSEMAALLRIIVADAEGGVGSGSVLGAWATESEQKAAGARLLVWVKHILKAQLEAANTHPTLRDSRRFPAETLRRAARQPPPRSIVTPGEAKRRVVRASKERQFQEAQGKPG